jgi:glycerophosphoryl diester phosphodiesterase
LAAFRYAQQSQADGIELDIHLSADFHLVVIHDEDVSRTTNGQGQVRDLRLEELRRLDAGQGEAIPTLPEVFDLIGDQLFINVELKGFSGSASLLPEKVIDLVDAHQLDSKIIYSSFNPFHLIRIRHFAPQAKCGLLLLPGSFGATIRLIFSRFIRPWSLHPHYSSISKNYILHAKQKNQAVITYTVNQPQEMRRLFSLGIQGIITDDPVQAVEVRNTI